MDVVWWDCGFVIGDVVRWATNGDEREGGGRDKSGGEVVALASYLYDV